MESSSFEGKKILILGGGSQHCKVVEAAKALGVITYVTDNLVNAEAKALADHSFMINVTDTDRLAQLCKDESIDGIVSGWFDFIQPYYQELCEKTGLPCYGTREQFQKLTRKSAFKECCSKYGVGTPTELKLEELGDRLPFKVIVKPSNSRGSRAATICGTKEEVLEAAVKARNASYDGECVIERYIENRSAFCVTYLFVDGKAYLEQLSDAYFGDKEYGLDRIAIAYVSPSARSKEYMEKENGRLIHMLKELGVKDGPFVAQGFFGEDDVLFFDPGRRFAGGEYERALKRTTGLDIPKAMIIYAITGKFPHNLVPIDEKSYLLNGKKMVRLLIDLIPGKVVSEEGFDEIQRMDEVEYVAFYHHPGDVIEATGSTQQRYAHIIVVADTETLLQQAVDRIYDTIKVYDENHRNMIVARFNSGRLSGGGG